MPHRPNRLASYNLNHRRRTKEKNDEQIGRKSRSDSLSRLWRDHMDYRANFSYKWRNALKETIMAILNTQGISLYYEVYGDPANPAMLLLSGLGGTGRSWSTQIDRFATDYYVVVPDHRGTGQS